MREGDVTEMRTGRTGMPRLFAGLDVSTQSCKLVVIDEASGTAIHVDAVDYDRDLPQYETRQGAVQGLGPGVSESDPRMWIDAVNLLLQRLAAAPEVPRQHIRCLAVSGQQHGLVALDRNGNLARPRAKLWNDFSAAEECELLTERIGGVERMVQEVGNTQRTGYTAPKILHMLRHEPECYDRATTLFLVHNYVNWYLTGGPRGGVAVMEPGDTSGMALWNPVTRDWSPAVIEAIDPHLGEKLPPVMPSDRTIGTIAPDLAATFGFSTDCAVDAGSGDNMYGAVGTGNFTPGVVTISLGTSGTAYAFMREPFVDPTGEIAAFCDSTGHYLPLVCVSNMANGYHAVLDRFGMTHVEFDEIVERTPPGNDGRLLVPWYAGERTPDLPRAAPLYFGFSLEDFTRERLGRAVLEGHVLNLFTGFERLPVAPTTIHVTGGLSQSPSWCQMIADVFEAETVPVSGEGAALGAAIHAAWVWLGEHADGRPLESVAAPFVVRDEARKKTPTPQRIEVYRRQKRLFRSLTERVRGLASTDDPFALRAPGGES